MGRRRLDLDEDGWVIPSAWTISRIVYDLAKQGQTIKQIAAVVNRPVTQVGPLLWQLQHRGKRVLEKQAKALRRQSVPDPVMMGFGTAERLSRIGRMEIAAELGAQADALVNGEADEVPLAPIGAHKITAPSGSTASGAMRAAARIREYWIDRGYPKIEATVEKCGQRTYGVRTNIGPLGFPPK
jgi:hypothetical protein